MTSAVMPLADSVLPSAASVVVPARTPILFPASASKLAGAPAGSITAAPSTKVGSEKLTCSRRARVIDAAPHSRSMRPSATASKRSCTSTGTNVRSSGAMPSWPARCSATASQISTE
jgi:hypothetical protein